MSLAGLAVAPKRPTGPRRSRPILREIQAGRLRDLWKAFVRDRSKAVFPLCGKVKGSGKEEEEEERRSLKGLAEEPGRDLEPEEPDPVDYQSRWKRWTADIEFRLALFESPERKNPESGGRGQLDSQGVGEALELEPEAREDPRPKASETSEPDPSLALEPEPAQPAEPTGEEPSPARGLAQGEADLLLSPETGPWPSPSPGGDFSFAQALDLEDVEVLGTDPSSSTSRPALKERCIARWCFQLRKAPSLLSEPSEAFSRRTLALHRQHIVASIPSSITSTASAPASPRSREGDFHSRGQQWLEEKRAKEHHLREQHRDLELRECTFQPVMPSRASRSRSAGQSARSVYDRQRRWQEAVREKHDRQRQRQRADDATELARYKTKGQPQEDVEHAFACFHERNRKWQSMRQARQAQQQRQQLEREQEQLEQLEQHEQHELEALEAVLRHVEIRHLRAHPFLHCTNAGPGGTTFWRRGSATPTPLMIPKRLSQA
ncbi:unnamed protein product [Symbiodinium necroappetens]|uniref:Uncharacterized protein n=1 Tax=Symbiodinium necroappetens TaxID=1628268 RepID=A0A812NYQ9_9DINO|nr:unnamed protein product [Symbiodinium necroappetens]